jgi:hypothetical protein
MEGSFPRALAKKVGDGADNRLLLVWAEFREHRQRKDLLSRAL